jgi:uncharacterized protein (TIGR02147 family)
MNLEQTKPNTLPKSYVEILKSCLSERMLKNENYSLRAFARDLDITPSHLSEILNKKANLSLKAGFQIAPFIYKNIEDQKLFCKLIEIDNAIDSDKKNELSKQLYNYDSTHLIISNEDYDSISDWNSLALLELINLHDFQYDLDWISNRLSISSECVEKLLCNLSYHELIEIHDHKIEKKYDYFVLPNGNNLLSAKNFHKKVLQNASEAIDKQRTEERNFTAAFLHVKKENITLISEKIKKFRRELAKEFESENDSDSVYMFSIQLFRVDNENLNN